MVPIIRHRPKMRRLLTLHDTSGRSPRKPNLSHSLLCTRPSSAIRGKNAHLGRNATHKVLRTAQGTCRRKRGVLRDVREYILSSDDFDETGISEYADHLLARLANQKVASNFTHVLNQLHQCEHTGGVEVMGVPHFQHDDLEVRILNQPAHLIAEEFGRSEKEFSLDMDD